MLPNANIDATPSIDMDGILCKWLEDRNRLFIALYKLSGIHPYSSTHDSRSISRFCEKMIDYLSLGHFRIFEQLSQHNYSSKRAETMHNELRNSTQLLVELNEKYSTEKNHEIENESVQQDLSKLGEYLAERVEIEDRLVACLLGNNAFSDCLSH